MPAPALYAQIRISDWDKFRRYAAPSEDMWLYRGASRVEWRLETTLERNLSPRHRLTDQGQLEKRALDGFKRRAHHYVSRLPSDTLGWAALLRHHGGPSRLLDVTRSPYVALYFAVEGSEPGKPFVVWAIKYGALHARIGELLMQRHQLPTDPLSRTELANLAFHQSGLQPQIRAVVAGEPDEMNERMAAQQGLFLLQFDLSTSFEKNLLGTFGVDADFGWGGSSLAGRSTNAPIRKLVFSPHMRSVAWKELRAMNISAATLYPGLDGFARSLALSMKFGD